MCLHTRVCPVISDKSEYEHSHGALDPDFTRSTPQRKPGFTRQITIVSVVMVAVVLADVMTLLTLLTLHFIVAVLLQSCCGTPWPCVVRLLLSVQAIQVQILLIPFHTRILHYTSFQFDWL